MKRFLSALIFLTASLAFGGEPRPFSVNINCSHDMQFFGTRTPQVDGMLVSLSPGEAHRIDYQSIDGLTKSYIFTLTEDEGEISAYDKTSETFKAWGRGYRLTVHKQYLSEAPGFETRYAQDGPNQMSVRFQVGYDGSIKWGEWFLNLRSEKSKLYLGYDPLARDSEQFTETEYEMVSSIVLVGKPATLNYDDIESPSRGRVQSGSKVKKVVGESSVLTFQLSVEHH